jgi:predicted RNase H-like HicB family nuclease
MANYIALIHKDPTSDFGVSFPDFPGCVTAGPTLDEARSMAQEALGFHIEGMLEDGDALPEPSSLEAVMAEAENRDAVAFMIDLPDRPAPTVRVNITVSAKDLEAIDTYAEAHGFTRSGFLVQAAKDRIKRRSA